MIRYLIPVLTVLFALLSANGAWAQAAPGLFGPAVEKDTDGDGVYDSVDRCPEVPEDQDGFEDQDGCPDNDNDQDGIPDVLDKCPNDPEVVNGFQDQDGCPDKNPPPVRPPTAPGAPAGCTKDSECKGNRICNQSGQCAAPTR